jgi:hypothetical protein
VQGVDGSFQLAEYSLLVGVKLTDVPPGIGTRQDLLAKYRLTTRGSPLCWNLSSILDIRHNAMVDPVGESYASHTRFP